MATTQKQSVNIGKFARWCIRQGLGTEKGQAVIDLIEQGYGAALVALSKGKWSDAWDSLPTEGKDAVVAFVLSNLQRFLPFIKLDAIDDAIASLLIHQRERIEK